MHIYLKNKFLYFHDYKIKCSIGKRGLTKKKREGDLKTPGGKFKFKLLLYRKDRIRRIRCKIKRKIIRKNMGWCDDANSAYYNQLVKLSFEKKAEKLYLKKNSYDLILVLNYNMKPVIKNKGSAIFLHIANKKFSPTKGCVAITKRAFIKILPLITKKTYLFI
jgi:L,D-peptidoglycan transpeptidase YkuD (ErfK/YbiS/YcfS/YnhG family)